ncbi:MAG: hypothetical protein RR162_00435 [Oscillospiraceae bacterium]
MTVTTKEQAWAEANKIFPTDYEKDYSSSERAGYDIYRHRELNYYSRICDLGDRLEVLTGEYGENVTNIWIKPEETVPQKNIPHRAIIHYTLKKGNGQHQLQLLAENILACGKRVGTCRHTSQLCYPNGEQITIETGSYCIEVINELTGSRYWVHFSGCTVTEIIEEYIKQQ